MKEKRVAGVITVTRVRWAKNANLHVLEQPWSGMSALLICGVARRALRHKHTWA